MPGLYWRFPIIWRISKSKVTQIPQGSVGIVESVDGQPIQRVDFSPTTWIVTPSRTQLRF